MYLWLTMILRVYQVYARIVQNIEGQYLDAMLEKILDTRQHGFLLNQSLREPNEGAI